MGGALECAECSVPATVLIVHPALYRMVVPACVVHGALAIVANLDVIPVDDPDAADYTVLRAWIVPRR